MLSSRINRDDTGDEEDQSTMPGDYEAWPNAASRATSRTTMPPPRPSARPTSRPRSRPPPPRAPSSPELKPWPPVTRETSSGRHRRRRRRPLTPEIVIERHHRHHSSSRRHHSSSGRNRIITIPLDNRPTLGLRGPPKQVLEIERVRCHRRRKHRSRCYDIDYDISPPIQPQATVMYADPLSNPYFLPAQPSLMIPASNSTSWLTTVSNLTPEIIQNLPKQTVHLPPIHLPGSHADTNTELETVVFPVEIVNPIDGTLSTIQSNSMTNSNGAAAVQPFPVVPAPSQFINAPTNTQSPLQMLAAASGPFMQQVQDLFQRITLSQPQPTSSPYNQTMFQPSIPALPQYNTVANSFYNAHTIPPINATTFTPANSANTMSYRPINNTAYPLTSNSPYSPANITPYRSVHNTSYNPSSPTAYNPANITPYHSVNNTSYTPTSPTTYNPANITPYHSVNNTSYTPTSPTTYNPANITPYHSVNNTSYTPTSRTTYSPANITPYHSVNNTSYTPANGTAYSPANITPYSPANITAYQPITGNSTPSNPMNIGSYHAIGVAPSNSSTVGPYRSANITPLSTGLNRSSGNSMLPPSMPSASTPYITPSSLASSDSFNSSSSGPNNRPLNVPHSSQPSSQTSYHSNTPMPKSILRNSSPYRPLNTTYTRLNPSNFLSTNGVVREMATVV